VAGALPGETIRFRRVRRHRQYDEARLEEIVSPAAGRVSPRCAHYEICGGCALQHLENSAQLRHKQQQLAESLERLAQLSPQRWLQPIASGVWNYRRRARLGVKYVTRKGRVLVGFRERATNLVASLERCEVLAPPIDGLIAPLAALIQQLSIRERLPQIEVSVGRIPRLWYCACWRHRASRTARCCANSKRSTEFVFSAERRPRYGACAVRRAPSLFYTLPAADLELGIWAHGFHARSTPGPIAPLVAAVRGNY